MKYNFRSPSLSFSLRNHLNYGKNKSKHFAIYRRRPALSNTISFIFILFIYRDMKKYTNFIYKNVFTFLLLSRKRLTHSFFCCFHFVRKNIVIYWLWMTQENLLFDQSIVDSCNTCFQNSFVQFETVT